jgi:hypothetical protein
MGYDVHITRAESWSENEGCWIGVEEWEAAVRDDPELRFASEDGGHTAKWISEKADPEAWLDWNEGNVFTKNPDRALILKMCEIAGRLNANVQGDDGERYPEALLAAAPKPRNFAAVSVALSVAALVLLALAFRLDSGYAPGVPRSLVSALAVVGPMILGVFAWILGALLAVASWFVGKRSRLWSLGAVVTSVAMAGLFFLSK